MEFPPRSYNSSEAKSKAKNNFPDLFFKKKIFFNPLFYVKSKGENYLHNLQREGKERCSLDDVLIQEQ